MPSIRINNETKTGVYFLTFTIKNWYYIFDRHNRWEILLNSLKYCQEKKNLKIYAYVFMLNHLHLIVQNDDVSGFVRDFKKFTAFEIMKNLQGTEPRVAELFQAENKKYQIWEKTNMPKQIETEKFFHQKREYIETNPVRKGYVEKAEYWKYSSASKSNLLQLSYL